MASKSLNELWQENSRLREELRRQWEFNHFEHCRRDWPHEGMCHWPIPPILLTRDPNEASEPQQKPAEESAGPH